MNLRTAEAIAQLGTVAGPVGGPADAPPSRPEDEPSWTQDWIKRAQETLGKAREMHARGVDVLQERAKTIVDQILTGARNVRAGVKNVAKSVFDELHELEQTAQSMSNAWSGTQAVVLAVIVIGALWYFTRHR